MQAAPPALRVLPEVAAALAEGRPVVALETTLIAHGLPRPDNLEVARRLEAIVRGAGAVPATVGLADGRVRVGLTDELLERFATEPGVCKVGPRDLGPVLARGGLGATTVAGSLILAGLAGIRVLCTGGIGGVHRGGQDSLDISADLAELARSRALVVCAGAKGILDLPRTLEVLETLGVPVVGYATDRFPAFWCRDSGLAVAHRVDEPEAAARLATSHWSLGLAGAVLLVNPPPAAAALDPREMETHIARALADAEAGGIRGQQVTPFLLARLAELTGRDSLRANVALLEHNAALAAEVAVALGRV